MRLRDLLTLAIVSILVLGSLGCGSMGPVIETGEGAEVTHDGLHRVRRARTAQRVWVKPDLDLSGYTKLLPVDAGIHYKRPPRRIRREFPLTERQMAFVRDGLREEIAAEITRRGDWTFVTEPGPDVLLIRGAIIDLVVTTPGSDTGRSQTYSRSIGAATLVIEIYDSESREILARIADRREITHDSTSWRNDPITNRAAAKRTFRHWARKVADGLDAARSLEPQPEPVDG